MAKQIFHIFGHLNPAGEASVYDTDYNQTRFYLCDTAADLPTSGFTDMDFAATKDFGTFYVANDGQWVAPHPVHSVFFTDEEELNPASILGYGIWELVGPIPSLAAWGWKRTE